MAHTDEKYNAILNRRNSDVEFQWKNFHLRLFSMNPADVYPGSIALQMSARLFAKITT